MKYLTTFLCLAVAVAIAVPHEVLAQVAAAVPESETQVTFSWGETVAQFIVGAGAVAAGIVGMLKGYLPGPVKWANDVFKLDQVITRCIQAAAYDLAHKLDGKTLTVDVKSALVAQTLRNVQASAKSLAKKYQETLELKVKARVEEYVQDRLGPLLREELS